MTSTLRLEDCGDFLSLAQYCAWRGEGIRTVRRQIRLGMCFVMPCEDRPRLRWRRTDCERRMEQADVLRQRTQRARWAVAS
jgi:hypothetical protein